jgi:tRNA(fMet)-specific endonuclease VapC
MEKMGNTLFLDTDILIDLLRNKTEIVEWIKNNEKNYEFATSTINLFELYTGAFKSLDSEKKIKDVEELSEKLKVISFLSKHSKEAGKQRAELEKNGISIDSRDILIGSVALVEESSIKTNNIKHFERIKGLRIV